MLSTGKRVREMLMKEVLARYLKRGPSARRPRILLMPDKRGWIFDACAKAIAGHLSDEFDFSIRYVEDGGDFDARKFDLVYVFFWGETVYKGMNIDPMRLVKHVASHRWEDDPAYGPCTPRQFAWRYLRDCSGVHCTSPRLGQIAEGQHPSIHVLPSGYDARQLFRKTARAGQLVVGWSGNIADGVKQVDAILRPACGDRFALRLATGQVPRSRMNEFYNGCDVVAVTSRHEGHPMPLIEGMAAGCFPVVTDVGIAREVITSGINGLIVEQNPEAFREAFTWCAAHLEQVRSAGIANADLMRRTFSWPVLQGRYRVMLRSMLEAASAPRFRNDDVSGDTPFDRFKAFCEIFWRNGHTQLHGVTLRGRTCDFAMTGSQPTPYAGIPPLSEIPNSEIRTLAADMDIERRTDLLAFLNASPDEIALHGLYHVDHSVMSQAELRADLAEGLDIMQKLFPRKLVRYFIAPFNRTSEALVRVCREFDLHVLGATGVHLEEAIERVSIERGAWYRYHHHRFYPESTCRYYPTTLQSLDAALQRR